mmetsp:Transcript_36991/g.82234  ORF Transcript_36991/g.82234 Transcript_36991/m.82234 type:complete len:221 (+) Transcript_36991:947-1609(+)
MRRAAMYSLCIQGPTVQTCPSLHAALTPIYTTSCLRAHIYQRALPDSSITHVWRESRQSAPGSLACIHGGCGRQLSHMRLLITCRSALFWGDDSSPAALLLGDGRQAGARAPGQLGLIVAVHLREAEGKAAACVHNGQVAIAHQLGSRHEVGLQEGGLQRLQPAGGSGVGQLGCGSGAAGDAVRQHEQGAVVDAAGAGAHVGAAAASRECRVVGGWAADV